MMHFDATRWAGNAKRTLCQGLLLFTIALGPASAPAQLLPANRTPGGQGNWVGLSGVPGGIPATNRTVYATYSPGVSLSTLQSAIESCPSNQIIRLNAGTYSLGGMLKIDKNGVTVVGAGKGKTIISGVGSETVEIGNENWYHDWGTPNASRHLNITNQIQQGDRTVKVSSVGDLANGALVFIDQQSDTNETCTTGVGSGCDPQGYTSVANPNYGGDRYRFMLNRVTNIVGNTIYLSEPIDLPNWQTNLNPQIWWFGAQPVCNAGLESVSVTGTGQNEGVDIQNAFGCWIRDCSISGFRYPDYCMVNLRCQIDHCDYPGPKVSTDDYVIELQKSFQILVQDNWCSHPGTFVIYNGGSGVIGYNYYTNTTGNTAANGQMQPGIAFHGGNPHMVLIEGNVGPGVFIEDYWGSSEYITCFRNRFTGVDEANWPNQINVESIVLCATQRMASVIGNVMGTAGKTSWYEDSGSSYSCHGGTGQGRIWWIGEHDNGPCNADYDPVTMSTLIRLLNWDSVNGSIFDANGHSVSELPQSLYLTSKPPSFGSLLWPPVDPSNPTYSMSRTNVPAGYRLALGVDVPGSGAAPPVAGVISFGSPLFMATTPTSGTHPLAVSFSIGAGSGTNCTVRFGDGTSVTNPGSTTSHTYSSVGSYTVSLQQPGGVVITNFNYINVTN